MLFKLGFKALKQCESVRCAAGKPSNYLALIESSDLARIAFHNRVAKADLAIATDYYFAIAAH
jgi:uncharacterized protein YaiL (DUF2058 family)